MEDSALLFPQLVKQEYGGGGEYELALPAKPGDLVHGISFHKEGRRFTYRTGQYKGAEGYFANSGYKGYQPGRYKGYQAQGKNKGKGLPAFCLYQSAHFGVFVQLGAGAFSKAFTVQDKRYCGSQCFAQEGNERSVPKPKKGNVGSRNKYRRNDAENGNQYRYGQANGNSQLGMLLKKIKYSLLHLHECFTGPETSAFKEGYLLTCLVGNGDEVKTRAAAVVLLGSFGSEDVSWFNGFGKVDGGVQG
jgi:hypothetical protein